MERICTLHLSGEDAISMYNSLFNPTRDQVMHTIDANNKISDGITIEYTDSGFVATIEGLDLSFIDK